MEYNPQNLSSPATRMTQTSHSHRLDSLKTVTSLNNIPNSSPRAWQTRQLRKPLTHATEVWTHPKKHLVKRGMLQYGPFIVFSHQLKPHLASQFPLDSICCTGFPRFSQVTYGKIISMLLQFLCVCVHTCMHVCTLNTLVTGVNNICAWRLFFPS